MILLAHGADPQPLPWFVLMEGIVVALVALGLSAFFTFSTLAPILRNMEEKKRSEVAGWVAIALGLLLAVGVWITRQSVVEAVTPPSQDLKHQHTLGNGGQMAMWGDYHAELGRSISGEYRLWLCDAYQRTIASNVFEGRLVPRDPKTGALNEGGAAVLDESLDHQYRFALMPQDVTSVQVQLKYPGGTIKLNFIFDGKKGRHSVTGWCRTRP